MNKIKPIQNGVLLFMKISLTHAFILTVFASGVAANDLNGQQILEKRVSLHVENKEIRTVLREISKQTSARFTYQPEVIQASRKVSLDVDDMTLRDILGTLFDDTVIYSVVDDEIIFKIKYAFENKFLGSPPGSDDQAVEFQVTGKVVDENDAPLPGVNVVIKGTSKGTSTDANGSYVLFVENESDVLVFSFIGYTIQEVPVQGRSIIDVAMSLDVSTLGEIVIVGYGEQEKQKVTGAITTVKGESIVKSNAADLSNSLVGRVPGVITMQNGAEPGLDAAEILIRGRATLNNNGPLIMVDGIQRDMNQIDPNEIESMTVLKDAAAVAIYGVRGGNGVILITTKRGTTGKPKFSYTGYVGFQNPTQTPDYLNAYDYARLYNEAQLNDDPNSTPTYSDEDLQKYKDGSSPFTHPDVDWFDEIITSNAPQTRHSLSVTGGTDKIKYFMLLGLFNQDGMYSSVNFKKYNLRLNVDTKLSNSTTLSVGLFGGLERKKEPGVPNASTWSEGIYGIITYLPNNAFPVRNEDGSLASLWGQNPIGELFETGYIHKNNNNLQSSFTLDQKLDFVTKGLSLKMIFAKDFGYGHGKSWRLSYKSYLYSDGEYEELLNRSSPSLTEDFSQFDNNTFEAHLNYNRTFNRHQVAVLALYTQSAFYDNGFDGGRFNYASAAVPQLFAGPELNMRVSGNASESGREGVVGRIAYSFDQRYLLEANFGYNGSENFPPGNRYGFFPAASVGWMLSNESFFESLANTINVFKVRASYGEVGNDRVGGRRFLYIPTVAYSDGYTFGGQPAQGVALGEPSNPFVTWEKARKTNIGFDAEVKGGLLGLRADVFYEKRSNILGSRNRSVPATYGFELPIENFAQVNNKGFEVELNHQGKVGGLTYFAGFNYTYARNEVAAIDEPSNIPAQRRQTGKPLNQYFGYVHEGYYQTEEEVLSHPRFEDVAPQLGDLKYKDINNDGIIDTDDITAIGNSDIPQNVFGLTLGGTFGGFDFNMLWQGAGGYNVEWKGGTIEFLWGGQAWEHHKDRWTPENRDASYPKLSLEQYSYKQELSSFWIKDQSYVRLKNIELGYTIPKTLFPEGAIEKLRVYVSATNLLTFSKVDQFDPEAPSGYGDAGSPFYPQQKGIFGGVNLTF